MDKGARLGEIVGELTAPEALKLARLVELARLRGKEELPTDLVLTALRPRLREARSQRVPTLCRLVAGAFEHFLVDREDDPRLPGRIARTVIAPWWQALAMLAGPEIRAFEDRLVALHAHDRPGSLDELTVEAQAAAAGWAKKLAGELATTRAGTGLRKLFPGPGFLADVQAIATVLPLAELLGAAFVDIDRVLTMTGQLDGRQIVDLVPEAVTVAKQHYLAISDAHGMNSVFLALALLNRLRYPWQILRLGRALSWKPNDSLLRDTEFGVVGERLISGLARTAHDIARLAEAEHDALDIAAIADNVAEYMEDAEGLLGEFGFRRDSAWGEAILKTRVAIADALDQGFMNRLGEHMLRLILPVQRRHRRLRDDVLDTGPPQPPTAAQVGEAVATVRLLMFLLHRGSRHGFGQPAQEVVEMLSLEIDRRAADLLDALRQAPDDAVAAGRIDGAVAVLDVLFEDGRGTTLARRAGLARQAKS